MIPVRNWGKGAAAASATNLAARTPFHQSYIDARTNVKYVDCTGFAWIQAVLFKIPARFLAVQKSSAITKASDHAAPVVSAPVQIIPRISAGSDWISPFRDDCNHA
jgi:hypothetical protein